jgi:hypothetical protein
MKNWTDKIINWHQLPATEVKRLVATWGMTERQLANYDAKHGFEHSALVVPPPAKEEVKAEPKKSVPAKKAPMRQKHTGANGEIKFVEHRNLYIGFWGSKVVVTKRTREQCQEFLSTTYGID